MYVHEVISSNSVQIVDKYCKRDWRPRETRYRQSFTISDESDALGAAVSPASEGQFWSVVVDGINSVSLIDSLYQSMICYHFL